MGESSHCRPPLSQRTRRSSVLGIEALESNATQRYRDSINQCLATIGKEWDADLELNHRGICSFQCGGFVVVIEVPWDSKAFFVYTSIMKCLPTSTAVMRKALELNYLTQATAGCTIALDPNQPQDMEITLCRCQRIDGTNHSNLASLVKNLLRTACTVQKQLDRAHRPRLSLVGALPLRQQQSISRVSKPRPGRRSKRPPPAPRLDTDATPTISNKSKDKHGSRGTDRKNDSITTIQNSPTKDNDKMNKALELTVATATGKGPHSLKSKTSSTSRRSQVIRRLSRMASKGILRPRASSGRHRLQPKTILESPIEERTLKHSLEI